MGLSGTASPVASEGSRALTNGAMVGPGPAGGSGAFSSETSLEEWRLRMRPPPQALRGPGSV